ncbi:formylglycine-generating enzyme family protein [Methanococcoides orientis]|uniref:formylglycine-generating enzyme family protein n=1 Tax=Methanococcoides orientis TaxID=2822137 RepID=UPI001E2F879A|nr:formylglycine-generating enzyme family protein [Methanococcoides orientis]
MDGNYGGELPVSSIGGKKATRFNKIDIANANKVHLGAGWVAFTSPLDADLNIPLDGISKQVIKPDTSSQSTSSLSPFNNTELHSMVPLGLKATDFEIKLHEATRMWREKEEKKRKQNGGNEFWGELGGAEIPSLEDELLNELDGAEIPSLEDELLNELDGAEIPSLEDELLNELDGAEIPSLEDELLNELDGAEIPSLEDELLNELDGAEIPSLEDELLNELDGAEIPSLEDELLNELDGAEIPSLEDELLNELDGAEIPGLEDELLNELDGAEVPGLEDELLNELDGTERKQLKEGNFHKEKAKTSKKEPEFDKLSKVHVNSTKSQFSDSQFHKEQGETSKKRPSDGRLRKKQENTKRKHKDVVTPHKSMKVTLVKWLSIIIAAWLVVSFVVIPLIDDSEAVPSQYLEALGKNSIVIASENRNDDLVKDEEVMSSQEIPENYINSIGMKFVLIHDGEFMMGSPDDEEGRYYYREGPVHEVMIGNDYYLGKYEVTQKQWAMVMGNNPSYVVGNNRPVEGISWDDAQEFVKKLNSLEGTDKYRLPSEAEWEYACRAGTNTKYYFGDDEADLHKYAWYSGDIYSVGHLNPNSWGLYDMHGNVYEFVQDEWHSGYEGAPEVGTAWDEGISDIRTLRSGSVNADPSTCRSASRTSIEPDIRLNNVGFRLVMDV